MSVANVSKVIAVFVVIILLFSNESSSQNIWMPPNPCPDVFKYMFDGNQYYGLITQNSTSKTRREITIGMAHSGILNQNYKGKISPNIPLNRISDFINLGLSITYRVHFPQNNVLPRVINITDNGIRTCSSFLYHLDMLPRAEINLKIVLQEKIISGELTKLNLACGRENESFTRLRKRAAYGENVEKSRFPWIAAIYKKKDNKLIFQCGGTLISKWSVISTSHCFCKQSVCSNGEDILVSLGRHGLNEDGQSGMRIGVQNIIIHPQYTAKLNSFDADIAIVQLAQSVSFSNTMRPICLWEGPSDDNYESMTGIIVGRGVVDATPAQKSGRATIVPIFNCFASAEELIHGYTPQRTFCAEIRDGSGTCVGDSGSGIMIKKEVKWILKGIPTADLENYDQTCNQKEFVDITKFIVWIKAHMLV